MEPKPESRFLRSGQLARLAGVSTDTLRHYEKIGVLPRPGRTASGYRQYSAEAASRVRLVRAALALGFRLEDLARVLRVRDRGGTPCREVHRLALEKLADLDRKIAELTAFRAQLVVTLAGWEARLERTPAGQRAGLLESLILPSRKDNAEK